MNELISIVVPIYKTEAYLEQCLESLINQTYTNLEIICVNDGSPDNSIEILERYAQLDNRVKVINQENLGLSAARNKGVEYAVGQYIMFVDSDDWIDIEMCEDMLRAMISNDASASMCCYAREFGTKAVVSNVFDESTVFTGNEYWNVFFAQLAGIRDKSLAHPERSDVSVSACMQLFHRKCIENISFISTDEIGTEDWLFQLEIYCQLDKVVYINKPFYHYRKTNNTSLTSTYKEDLYSKWNNLYDRVMIILKKYNLYARYSKELNNKIAVSLLFLGLNEIKSPYGMRAQSKRLDQICCLDRYELALNVLDITAMPVQWKVFFFLCKKKLTYSVVILLQIIEFLRKH